MSKKKAASKSALSKLDSNILRQGDVLLVRVNEIDPTAQPLKPTGDRVVLKEGEATGHAHAFYERERVSLHETARKDRHLKVVQTAYLRHEEHTEAPIVPGIYDLPVQVEWTDEDEPRVVAD